MLSQSNVTIVSSLLLGTGLLYWQIIKQKENRENCTANKEKSKEISSTTAASTKSSERVSPEEAYCEPCNPSSLDLSLLPCIRNRRSVFPHE